MGTRTHRNGLLLVMVLVSVFYSRAPGQESNTLYFMKGVPQSYQLNPATQPGCRFFLGFPGISPLQIYAENSAFSLKDIIFPLDDSLVTFLHPEADKDDFLDNLAPVNTMQVFVATDIFSAGYRSGNLYYTFDLSEKIYARLSYNDDLLDLLLNGNQRGDHFNFSNTNVDITSYFELATGNSRIVSERLKVGSRVKLLFGQVNLSTNNREISLTTDEDWTIRSDMSVRLSVPNFDLPVNLSGEVSLDSADLFDFMDDIDPMEILQSVFGNVGLGLDLGMHYSLTDKITLSGSLIDLAGIRWSANPHTIRQDATYVYSGIEINPGDTTGTTKNFFDSLKTVFAFTSDSDPYYTMLPLKLYVGGTYQVIDQIGFGILSRTEYYKKRLREQLTLSANLSPLKILTFSFSYTLFNNTYNSFGFGFSSRLGPFNLYLISDNVPTGYAMEQSTGMIIPYDSRILNLRIGMNLVFGCRTVKKKLSDLPLVY
jgi:hypothetical protein